MFFSFNSRKRPVSGYASLFIQAPGSLPDLARVNAHVTYRGRDFFFPKKTIGSASFLQKKNSHVIWSSSPVTPLLGGVFFNSKSPIAFLAPKTQYLTPPSLKNPFQTPKSSPRIHKHSPPNPAFFPRPPPPRCNNQFNG